MRDEEETMNNGAYTTSPDVEQDEIQEWVESLDAVLQDGGPQVASQILERLRARAQAAGVPTPFSANTPYTNTIPVHQQPVFPGDQEVERRIKSLIRWNALAMVVRANRVEHNIGGHISTHASGATLFEVGFNHFFRARTDQFEGDTIYFLGHASPRGFARALLEGRRTGGKKEKFPPARGPG